MNNNLEPPQQTSSNASDLSSATDDEMIFIKESIVSSVYSKLPSGNWRTGFFVFITRAKPEAEEQPDNLLPTQAPTMNTKAREL